MPRLTLSLPREIGDANGDAEAPLGRRAQEARREADDDAPIARWFACWASKGEV